MIENSRSFHISLRVLGGKQSERTVASKIEAQEQGRESIRRGPLAAGEERGPIFSPPGWLLLCSKCSKMSRVSDQSEKVRFARVQGPEPITQVRFFAPDLIQSECSICFD